jgi:diguanylate cyclase (GGDEF)-like protein/putative nucleotidyltransferase with HDIG domain
MASGPVQRVPPDQIGTPRDGSASGIPAVTQVTLDAELQPAEKRLTRAASAYFFAIVVWAAAVALLYLRRLEHDGTNHAWGTFAFLAAAAALTQLFVVWTPRNQSYHTSMVFLLPAVLLLPPELFVLVPLVQHVPEWLKERYAWYVQTFNIANYTLASLAAYGARNGVLGAVHGHAHLREGLGYTAAALAFVLVNHVLLAPMMRLANGDSIRELALFSVDSLQTNLALVAVGVAIAALWQRNLWLVVFALAPLVLIHRSLSVPQLQAEARIEAKTGLFNARHFAAVFADELSRAGRYERPLSLLMVDLDLLREINNTFGHLAGDAVIRGVADVFRQQLRHFDVPARFGGEEFSILLPETPVEQALEIAERVRRAVAQQLFEVSTSSDPIRATVSIGVATFPADGRDQNELIHQADLAVYRAKLQGRNRVLAASAEEPLLVPAPDAARALSVTQEGRPAGARSEAAPVEVTSRHPRSHATGGPRFLSLSLRLGFLVGVVSTAGIAAGIAGTLLGTSHAWKGMVAITILIALGQALAVRIDQGSISVAAVGALAGAALAGPRPALLIATTTAVVAWSAGRTRLYQLLFNIGTLTLASLTAAGTFELADRLAGHGQAVLYAAGVAAGAAYFAVNTGLLAVAVSVEGHEPWWRSWQERFAWLTSHYLFYGFIGAMIAFLYDKVGISGLLVFALPLWLQRNTQEAYLKHAQRSTSKLRRAAETIQTQNESLEVANRALKERSTAAMESLSATVDARDSYTAGHSRRVQQLALAIGRELGLSQAELDLLGHAALFHDIGKLAVPDSVLLKPSGLTSDEWGMMRGHAEEGARIIGRLGFLADAVPAIRHHHERYDGSGYPDGLKAEEIPLGARIIHVADALDSMLTTRVYRAARPAATALAELKAGAGTQFCPKCVAALERILPVDDEGDEQARPPLSAVS